jgi:hypothetical protein
MSVPYKTREQERWVYHQFFFLILFCHLYHTFDDTCIFQAVDIFSSLFYYKYPFVLGAISFDSRSPGSIGIFVALQSVK